MKLAAALVASLVLVGCTKSNPKSCLDGVCDDPRYPFCDTQGTLGGIQGECIAVTCEPNAFAECRDHIEVICNATGDNYTTTTCDRECMPETNGCQLCTANQTACTNGTLASCNSAGEVTSTYACPLGCEDESRCRELKSSNDLDSYFDQSLSPLDLILADATINTSTGAINGATTFPSFLVPAPVDGTAVRVFVARKVDLGNLTITATASDFPALAILATEELAVSGHVVFPADHGSAGGVARPDCSGGVGQIAAFGDLPPTIMALGAGGGGFGTAGGAGGTLVGVADPPPAVGGTVSGSPELVPLRGGCPGGNNVGAGGGAIQLVSKTSISIGGWIDVRGSAGTHVIETTTYNNMSVSVASVTAGGAGGGILIEAPSVTLGASARLLATGGSGGARDGNGGVSLDGTSVVGGTCTNSALCAPGGNSAGVRPSVTEATNGSDLAACASGNTTCAAGAGGGGAGRIRINTKDGTYERDAVGTVEAGVLTTGPVTTR